MLVADLGADYTGQMQRVVWAALPYGQCPGCRRAEVPAGHGLLVDDKDFGVAALDARCPNCSRWLGSVWVQITDDIDETAARTRCADLYAAHLAEVRELVEDRCRRWLTAAVADGRETGTDTEPGAYRDGGQWVAWDHDPTEPGAVVEVWS